MAKDPYAFVKKTGRDRYWLKQDRELEALIDPESGAIRKNVARPVKCVVCGSREHNLVFIKHGFRFVKCAECGLLFVNPQLDESKLLDHYRENESSDRWVDVLLSKAQLDYDAKHRFGEAVRRLEKIYPKSGRRRILDVGCSIGLFLDLMRKKGWDPLGMEINPKAVRHAREVFNLKVDEKLLHEVQYPKEGFQVVSMWGVLEHISQPDMVLKQIHPLLEAKGRLVLLVPNGHSLACRIMRDDAATFGGRNHLWYFSPETITRLLDRTGYRVTDLYTQLDQVRELTNFLRFNHPYLPPDNKVAKEEFQLPPRLVKQLSRFILKNHLGYKLIVFAEKKGKTR